MKSFVIIRFELSIYLAAKQSKSKEKKTNPRS